MMWRNKFMSKKTSSVGDTSSAAATSGGGVGLNDADKRNNNDVVTAEGGGEGGGGNGNNAPSFLLPTMHSSTYTSASAMMSATTDAAAIKPRSLRAHITGPPEEDEYGGFLESTKKFTVRRVLVSNVNVSPPASIADAPPTSDDEILHDEEEDDDMMSDEEDIDNDDEIVDYRATQESYQDENMGGGGNGYSDDDDGERGRMVYDPLLPTSNNEHEIDDEEDDYEQQEGEEVDYEYNNEATLGNNDGLGTNNNEDFEASLLLGLGASSSAFTTTGAASGNTDDDKIDKATALCHIINIETDRLLRDRSSSGIAELPNTDPSTLPTSMTSFLDVLTEEQRRTRHRYIPGVEGFRKLLKSEIKGDLARARRCRKFPPSSGGGPTKKQRNMRSTEDDDDDDLVEVNDDGMDVNDDYDGAADRDAADDDDDDGTSGGRLVNDYNEEENGDNISPKVVRGNVGCGSSNKGLGAAFVAPTKQARKAASSGALASLLGGTPFEDAVGSSSSSAGGVSSSITHSNIEDSRPPPTTVDSITTFHPPRPQESTSAKTRARLRRWETNPSEVETDLTTYRKTVGKTLDELDVARSERRRVEAVAGLVRGHLTSHLAHYRDEAVAIDDKLMGVTARCIKLDGEVIGRSVSTRGGSSGRGMREVITTLMTLEKEAKIAGVSGDTTGIKEDTPKDWRVLGVGGISVEDDKDATMKMPLSGGWLLVGDEVIVSSTGEEGIVVNIDGPAMDITSENKTAIEKESDKDSKSDEKKESSMSGFVDSMDIDKSPMKEENKDATTTTEEKEKKKDFTVRPTTISVQLVKSGQVQTFVPAEIEFNSSKMTILAKLSSTALAKRWSSMIKTSMATCLDHDFLDMTAYLDAVRASNADDKDDGIYSPKSVGQYDDNRSLLPFGSGLLAAPADFMAYPSVIPIDSLVDSLDDTARTVIYGMNEKRVIPTMPSSLIDYESRREEMNVLKGKVMQMRNRLVRQKRLRSLNEQSVIAGKHRAKKMERLLLEMQVDLRTLKGRLQTEVTDLGIDNGLMPSVPDKSGAVSASSTGDDPMKVEGSDVAVDVGMDQLSGSKE